MCALYINAVDINKALSDVNGEWVNILSSF